MTLQYWREYRTSFHLGLSWGVDASVICRTVHKIENLLIKRKGFHLPGKKKLCAEGRAFEVIVVDVAESPVERPQKPRVAKATGVTPSQAWRDRRGEHHESADGACAGSGGSPGADATRARR
jgi:hypothetical protein